MKSRTPNLIAAGFLLSFLVSSAVITTVNAQDNRPAPTQAPRVFPTPASTPVSTAAASQGIPQAAQPTSTPSMPKVIKVDGNLELDDIISVEVAGLEEWAAKNDSSKLVPYINGRAIRGKYPETILPSKNHLQFHLQMTPENKDVWIDLLGEPTGLRQPVAFSVGPEDEGPFDSVFDKNNKIPLTVISLVYGLVALFVVLGTLFVLIRLSRTTSLIRDRGDLTVPGRLKPYNLGRLQMAFWFFLIYASYTAIWLITDALDTITPSLLGLMGISAGTALGEALIDSGKNEANETQLQALGAEKQALEQSIPDVQAQRSPIVAKEAPTIEDISSRDSLNKQLLDSRTRLAQVSKQIDTLTQSKSPAVSHGFWIDILSDSDGYSFHRFQIFAWTIILGIIFVSAVYNSLNMPEFSSTLLGLMGLSSGTYIGFKFPEKK